MRATTRLIGALAGVAALAVAATPSAASPQFDQQVKAKYTTAKQKRAAGIRVNLSATDPGAQPAGNQPGVSRLTMRFAGARVNTRAGRRCTLPKARAESCPRRTRIGAGRALANLVGTNPSTGQVSVTQGIRQRVTAHLTRGGIYLVVKGVDLPTTAILKAKLSRRGVLKVNVARDLPRLPGGNKIVLTDFNVKVRKVARGKGKRRKALITTPRCAKNRRFKIVSSFVYDDSTRERVVTRQRCRR